MRKIFVKQVKEECMIQEWKDIKEQGWNNVLLGNGFSIGISSNFQYGSLLSIVDEKNIKMYPDARKLFDIDKIGTTNFEEVLRVIYHAYLVNYWNTNAIKSLYFNVRKSLIEAVNSGHVNYDDVDVKKIEGIFSEYNKIFTTNYDLIPYWSMMSKNFKGYCDFFWGEGNSFDLKDTEVRYHKTPIFYLHGAIHLKRESNGTIAKVKATGDTSIKNIIGENDINSIPLFISEGKSEMKLRRIRENHYLNFCYSQFTKQSDNLLVYGHGLDKEYDEHILNAIKLSPIKKIAISVYSGQKQEYKNVFTSNIKAFFADSDKKLFFFESESHPLSLK